MEGEQVPDNCPRMIPVAALPRIDPAFAASLAAVGEVVKGGLLWLSADAWAQCQNKPPLDPAVAAHLVRQRGSPGCCG